jgi:hypothetical protein
MRQMSAIVAVWALSCGGGGGSTPTGVAQQVPATTAPIAANITGTWTGSSFNTPRPAEYRWVLAQTGDKVTGNLTSFIGGGVSVSGRLTGSLTNSSARSYDYTSVYDAWNVPSGCVVNSSGTFTLVGGSGSEMLEGRFTARDANTSPPCSGSSFTGEFRFRRE